MTKEHSHIGDGRHVTAVHHHLVTFPKPLSCWLVWDEYPKEEGYREDGPYEVYAMCVQLHDFSESGTQIFRLVREGKKPSSMEWQFMWPRALDHTGEAHDFADRFLATWYFVPSSPIADHGYWIEQKHVFLRQDEAKRVGELIARGERKLY